MQPIEIFYSYSHTDEPFRDELEKQLSLLKRQKVITAWYDGEILPGQEWAEEINHHLNTADIILLLISPDFLSSDYCYSVEMQRAVERHERGEARIIPIILRYTHWQEAPFGKIQPLPKAGRPVKSWPDQDEAFFNVVAGIRKVVEELKVKHSSVLLALAAEQPASPILVENTPRPNLNIDTSKSIKSELTVPSTSPSLLPLAQDKEPERIIIEPLPIHTVKQFQLKHTLLGHSKAVRSVAISADGKIIVSGSDDKTIKVWDLQTGKLLRTLTGHSAWIVLATGVLAIAISTDGKTIVSGGGDDKTVRVWNLETGELLRTLTGHEGWVYGVAISGDGKMIVSGGGDKMMRVWNLEAGELLQTLTGHKGSVWGIALSADGKTIVSGSDDKMVRVWNLETGELLRTLADHVSWVYGVAISRDGKTIVSGSHDSTVRVWNLETGELLRTLTGHEDSVYGVAISADGKMIVSGSHDKTVRVWNLETGELLQTLTDREGFAFGVSLSGDGETIVSGSSDKTVRVWNLEA